MSVSIAELFARDPREHSEADFALIVKELREQRAKFVMGDKTAGAPAKKPNEISRLNINVEL